MDAPRRTVYILKNADLPPRYHTGVTRSRIAGVAWEARAQLMCHSIRVRSVRRSRPGANGGLATVIRNLLRSISTL